VNPAPFAAACLQGELAVLSSSPERFLKVEADGRVEAGPMKGTAQRSRDPRVDAEVRRRLLESTKDRAENLMIADLLRNDLGRVCRLGSVRVAASAELQEYETVYQLVSRVEGRLDEGRRVSELLDSSFPPGSMTGAPKRRSIEILRRLESRPRGPYSGIVGYWRPDGSLDTSVLIRSWVVHDGVARAGVGGGVIWDSTALDELHESRVKAAPLLAAWKAVAP
jgi:anthranilate/para-aminobenzoate synthase component I